MLLHPVLPVLGPAFPVPLLPVPVLPPFLLFLAPVLLLLVPVIWRRGQVLLFALGKAVWAPILALQAAKFAILSKRCRRAMVVMVVMGAVVVLHAFALALMIV